MKHLPAGTVDGAYEDGASWAEDRFHTDTVIANLAFHEEKSVATIICTASLANRRLSGSGTRRQRHLGTCSSNWRHNYLSICNQYLRILRHRQVPPESPKINDPPELCSHSLLDIHELEAFPYEEQAGSDAVFIPFHCSNYLSATCSSIFFAMTRST